MRVKHGLFALSCTLLTGMVTVASAQNENSVVLSKVLEQIEAAKPVSNLNAPKALMVSFLEHNGDYLRDLYAIITRLNKETPGAQPIQIVITIPDNYGPESPYSEVMRPSGEPAQRFEKWLAETKAVLGVKPNEQIPWLVFTSDTGSQNPWVQDIGEPYLIKFKGRNAFTPAFLDLNYAGDTWGSVQAIAMAKSLQIPLINAENYNKSELANGGDHGGNIESTHEGRVLVGNTISKKLLANLKLLTKQESIVVDTSFLLVGHVDEIFAFVPYKDECGAALFHADPLSMINLIWKNPKKHEDLNIIQHRASIAYFLKKGTDPKKDALTIEDFDLSKPLRKEDGETSYGDWVIRRNLMAHKSIMTSLGIIQKGSKCLKKIVGLPTVFEMSPEYDFADFENEPGALAPFGSPINMLVLRDRVVIPKPFFKDTVMERMKTVVPAEKIHVIESDISEYIRNYGSIHCSTNVLRGAE